MIQKLTKLLIDFQKIPKRIWDRTFMEISGFPHYENVCSNILKFYFETENEHNLNDLFLKSLFQSSKCKIDTNYAFGNVTVEREFTTKQNNRLDLLIETDEYIIGIENKIFHFLQNDLSDYSKTIDDLAKKYNKKSVKIILSLNKLNNPNIKENGFINVTYSHFFENIQNNLGNYILTAHNNYLIYLKDFITTMNKLNENNMENKALNSFFEQNAKIIIELIKEFNKYQNELHNKVIQLQQIISEIYKPRAEKQWIYNKRCLVHDYHINDFKVAVDTWVCLDGKWEIQLFGRDNKSTDFIFNVMCKNSEFLGKPIDEFRIEKNKLIFAEFKVSDMENVRDALIDLLKRIEKYIENNTSQQK